MEQQSARLRNTGFLTFFFSGICAISAGVVVSLLQEALRLCLRHDRHPALTYECG